LGAARVRVCLCSRTQVSGAVLHSEQFSSEYALESPRAHTEDEPERCDAACCGSLLLVITAHSTRSTAETNTRARHTTPHAYTRLSISHPLPYTCLRGGDVV
jgi:hypothetical protein